VALWHYAGNVPTVCGVVVLRYGGDFNKAEQSALVRALHIEDLVLARARSVENEVAWDDFIARFRGELYQTASRISKSSFMKAISNWSTKVGHSSLRCAACCSMFSASPKSITLYIAPGKHVIADDKFRIEFDRPKLEEILGRELHLPGVDKQSGVFSEAA
jgi:hypothetical protein